MYQTVYIIPDWIIFLVAAVLILIMLLMAIDVTRHAYKLAEQPDIDAYLRSRAPTAAQRRAAPYRVWGPSPYSLWLARRIQRSRAKRA